MGMVHRAAVVVPTALILLSAAPDIGFSSEITARGKVVLLEKCGRCHAVDGYNAIRPLLAGWTPDMIRDNVRRLDRLKAFMPPFAGSERDFNDLVAYLSTLRSAEWTRLYEETDDTGGGR